MKKTTCLLGLFILLGFTSAFSQIITGKVTDDSKQSIPYANVMLYSLPDSVFVAGTVTDEQGHFTLKNNTGKAGLLKASFVGYTTSWINAANDVPIILKPAGTELKQVVVTAPQKVFKSENGAIVANVKNTVLATLPSASEVIAQMPFVTQEDGAFTIFGKGSPTMYINNRLVRNQDELNRLSPKDIKNIKVITMPGAEYDASVKSVIRITTERTLGEGISGSFYTMQGYSNVYSGRQNLQLNYRKEAWDIFGSLGWVHQKRKANTNINQYIDLKDSIISQKNDAHEKMNGKVFNPELGFNFNPNSKISAGIKYNGTFVSPSSSLNIDLESKSPSVIQKVKEAALFSGNDYSHIVNGYFDGDLSSKLRLNVSADFLKSKDETDQNTYEMAVSVDTILSIGIQKNKLYAIKDIFTYHSGHESFCFGTEYSYTDVKQSYTINQPALGISNSNTRLKQNRGAIFASFQKQFFERYTLNAGLRYEHVDFNYYNNGIQVEEQSKKYNELFPNLSLSYADKQLNINASYERKINYPAYSQLRSNVQYDSPFTYEGGNPNLAPSFSNAFTWMTGWKRWQLMASYTRNKNEIQKLFSQYEDRPIILLRHQNVPTSENMGISLSFNSSIHFWNPRLEVSVYNQWLHLDNSENQYNHAHWEGKWNNTLRFKNDFIVRANLLYATSGNYGIVYLEKRWSTDLSVSKELLKRQLSLLAGVKDIFNTSAAKWNMVYQNIGMNYQSDYHPRQFYISLSYRFNPTRDKYKGQQATDEVERLK